MMDTGSGGAIVNIASIMGLSGGGLYPNIAYQATKGAVVNMTRALAVEWAPHNIRVNAVAPAGFCSIVVQAKGWSTIPTRSAAARIPAIVSSFSGMPSTAYFRSNSASSNPGG
jgi:NAD(P)-dependent dehydrogenase (short-subunit alcohol dehydrogenase family)